MKIIGKVAAAFLGLAGLGSAVAVEQYSAKLTAAVPPLRTGHAAIDASRALNGNWTTSSMPHASAYVRHRTGVNAQTGASIWGDWTGNADRHRDSGPQTTMGEAMGQVPLLDNNAGAEAITYLNSLTVTGTIRVPGSEVQSHATWSRDFSLNAGASFTFNARSVLQISGSPSPLQGKTWFNVDPANASASLTMADSGNRVRSNLTALITSPFAGDLGIVFSFGVGPDGQLSLTVTNPTASVMTGTLGAGAYVDVSAP